MMPLLTEAHALLKKYDGVLAHASSSDLNLGRGIQWLRMRTMREQRDKDGGKQLGTADEREIYSQVNNFFMEEGKKLTSE